jgi:hypothetical protein
MLPGNSSVNTFQHATMEAVSAENVIAHCYTTTKSMDCLANNHTIPHQRCDIIETVFFCVGLAAAIYRDSQNNQGSWKQLKSELPLLQCSSEQSVNCED